jgi:DNA-binding response OmpR family regulator
MRKKVLLIEDEETLIEIYKIKLEEEKIDFLVAKTAEEGLEIAKREKPDLILLDILLPTSSGIDFLENLRKDPEISNLEVVALSNFEEPETKKKAFLLGIKDYLVKADFTPSELIEKVKKYLNLK